MSNVAFSPNGRLALTASAGGGYSANARLWELAPGDPVVWSDVSLPTEDDTGHVDSFAPDGRSVLGVIDNGVREYDVVTSEPSGPILKHSQKTNAAYSPNGRHLLTIEQGYGVRFWDRASGRQVGQCPFSEVIDRFHFSSNGEWGALVRKDHSVSVCQIPTGKVQGPAWKLPNPYWGPALSADGRTAYTHDAKGRVQEWDVKTGKVVRVHPAPGTVRSVEFVEGKVIVVTGFNSTTTQQGTAANPLLAGLANNGGQLAGATGTQMIVETKALLPGSPAIGKGVANGITTDERGAPASPP